MKFFSFTKDPAYLPKDVWLHHCPLYEGAEPLWTGCTQTNKWAEGYYKNAAGHINFTLSEPPFAVCTVKPPHDGKCVEEGELWFDLDDRVVWDVHGVMSPMGVKKHLAEFGIKITLTKVQGLLLGTSKDELLAQIGKWNKLADDYLLNKQLAKLSAAQPTFFDLEPASAGQAAYVWDGSEPSPPPSDPEPMSVEKIETLYEQLVAGKSLAKKVKPSVAPYKWVLSKGTIIRTDVPEAPMPTLSNDF